MVSVKASALSTTTLIFGAFECMEISRFVLVLVYSQSVLLMAADGYCIQRASKVLVLSLQTVQLRRCFFLRHHLELLVSFRSSIAVSQIFEYLSKSFSQVSGFSGQENTP